MASIMFSGSGTGQYVLTQEKLETAKEVLADAIKRGFPKETRRVDVLCYVFDEMKAWAKAQTLDL